MRTLVVALFSLGLLASGTARANPIQAQILRARQIVGTHHVQLTYATIGKEVPTELKRDGTALTVTWAPLAAFNANTGSGLVKLASQQYCDCNVPAGKHTWTVKVQVGTSVGDIAIPLDVVDNYKDPTPPDLGPSRADFAPWSIPEPTEVQGLDCRSKCGGVVPGEPQSKADGPQARRDAGTTPPTNPPATEDDGCSIGGRPLAIGFLLLGAALFLGALLCRRRR